MSLGLIASRLVAVALVVVVACSTTWARSLEGSSSPVASLIRGRSLSKRANFDPSCAGVYDRELLGGLSRLCDDCYNVFREPKVATECRSNCFYNSVFVQCLEYLIPADLHEEYQAHVQTVGK
uniref:Crustacean hyperglycemic hormones 5 n=1 Tax=Penaeus monodon TaxID=6687 RepID=CHH5_PENMO|nr:RecName: Full=Crustacean hyperglycemic hormones 5; AltName: Full=Pm-SGP-V; Contains: RecName: Full=CHH precursor-related peptide 5; Short=CPRP 5; Contains: RecName: Full=Crustacean hyperglycemic hormone 5; Short=CHH 5; Flags: Precursor [Penaeus monodon]AAC84146.1 hyperglycemic hormone homolog PmSGP-V precursor [Penaeus monodon]